MAWFNFRRSASTAPRHTGSEPPILAGRFRLGTRIAEGADSEVMAGVDLRTGRDVAVKLVGLPPDMPGSQRQEWLARLRREAELGRRLAHPDIVAVLDAGLRGHTAWMAMERVRGHDLSRYIQPQRLLPEAEVLHIGARVANALAYAHVQGVVHRDLKPANVMINLAAHQVKLADFGVARLDDTSVTRTGLTLGTPAYMAPELLQGAAASAASDGYALGVMLFELLAGRRPHQADTLGELLRSTAQGTPASLAQLRPDMPAPTIKAVEWLLARNPARRPADLSAWASHVEALAALMTRLLAPSLPRQGQEAAGLGETRRLPKAP